MIIKKIDPKINRGHWAIGCTFIVTSLLLDALQNITTIRNTKKILDDIIIMWEVPVLVNSIAGIADISGFRSSTISNSFQLIQTCWAIVPTIKSSIQYLQHIFWG
jgi:hypothetical protein